MEHVKFGEALSPILRQVELTLWEYERENSQPPAFTDNALRSAAKIFMAVLMDRM